MINKNNYYDQQIVYNKQTEVMKRLEAAGETEKVAEFKEHAASALKYIYKSLKDLEFYSGESMNPDGTVSD